MYFVSGPVILVLLGVVFGTMLGYFRVNDIIQAKYSDTSITSSIIQHVPSTCYVIVIMIYAVVYRWIATKLTNWGESAARRPLKLVGNSIFNRLTAI